MRMTEDLAWKRARTPDARRAVADAISAERDCLEAALLEAESKAQAVCGPAGEALRWAIREGFRRADEAGKARLAP